MNNGTEHDGVAPRSDGPHDDRAILDGLGRRIRSMRLRQGMSAQELADASGLSRTSITRIETGAANPAATTLRRIADALGMYIGGLFVDTPPGTDGLEHGVAPPELKAFTIIRHAHGKHMDRASENWYVDLLTPDLRRQLKVETISVEPGRPVEWGPHEGESVIVVLEGRCEIDTGAHSGAHQVEAGDVLYMLQCPGFIMRAPADGSARILASEIIPTSARRNG